jgi:hypothetical protein
MKWKETSIFGRNRPVRAANVLEGVMVKHG